MVINRAWNAVKLYISFNVGSSARQLNVNALVRNSGSLSFTPFLPPLSLHLSLSLPCSLLRPLTSFNYYSSPSPESLYSLPSPPQRTLMMAGLSVFTSFKTNMWHSVVPAETFDGSALDSGLSELPGTAMKSLRLNIPVCCITPLVKERGSGCMKFKRRLKKESGERRESTSW